MTAACLDSSGAVPGRDSQPASSLGPLPILAEFFTQLPTLRTKDPMKIRHVCRLRPKWGMDLVGACVLGAVAYHGPAPIQAQATPKAIAAQAGPSSPTKSEGEWASEVVASHGRMLKELAAIRARVDAENPYYGSGVLETVQSELANLSESATFYDRWFAQYRVGVFSLDQGLHAQSVEALEKAHAALLQSDHEQRDSFLQQTKFMLGLAHLRWGETRNCVAMHTAESCILPIGPGGVHGDKSGSEAALALLRDVSEADPADTRSAWLINVACMTLGTYPDAVPAAVRVDPGTWKSDQAFTRFLDVAPDLGINRTSLTGAAAIEDFDGDGLLDLLTCEWDSRVPINFLRNTGKGGFEEFTREAGLEGILGGINLIPADYDNDGDMDLFVARGAWWGELGKHPNSLLQNMGAGRFADVSYLAGVAGEGLDLPCQSAAWADVDNDGLLDLYAATEPTAQQAARSQLFANGGGGRFHDIAEAAGVLNERNAKGCAFGDVDGDGLADLYVSNFMEKNRLYINLGERKFEDVAEERELTGPIRSFDTWFFDYNHDGNLDLFVTSYWTDVTIVAREFLGREPEAIAEASTIYRGNGKGSFAEVGKSDGITRTIVSPGGSFGDLDNDGWLDVYLATGYPGYDALMPNVMLRNQGGERFADVTTSGGFGHLQKGNSVVFADWDEDGDQDVFLQVGGAFTVDAFGDALFENPGFPEHNWIKIKLVGTVSNRSAIGARLKLRVRAQDGSVREIYRTVGARSSQGAGPSRLHIGLGESKEVEELEITWPASGITQRVRDLAGGRLWTIEEAAE